MISEGATWAKGFRGGEDLNNWAFLHHFLHLRYWIFLLLSKFHPFAYWGCVSVGSAAGWFDHAESVVSAVIYGTYGGVSASKYIVYSEF